MLLPWDQITTLLLDIDGTLTDGTLFWLGDQLGFSQRYHVRDGEAILQAKASGIAVIPLSRNRTACAKARMQHLGLDLNWVGVENKSEALSAMMQHHKLESKHIASLGDGRDDVPIFQTVAIGCAVANAHPEALQQADFVCSHKGGWGAVEDVVQQILQAKHFAKRSVQ